MANRLDDAFNWLILLLGTIAGALSQYPELYPAPPFTIPKAGLNIAFIRYLVLPIVILVLLWLWGILVKEGETQVAVKSFSWILAFMILIEDIVLLLFSSISPYYPHEGPGPGALLLPLLIIFFSPLYLSIILFIRVIRHRMIEIYKDSTFLNSRSEVSSLCILSAFYFLVYYWVFIGIG